MDCLLSLLQNDIYKQPIELFSCICRYLTGNPCTDYEGYREYVVNTLIQLTSLDGIEIERSEKILAAQKFDYVKKSILKDQRKYLGKYMITGDLHLLI